jgi:putative dehydrogenase
LKISVIGLGTMGLSTAANLLRAGHDVVGCDLRQESRDSWISLWGAVVSSAADLPSGVEAVVLFVISAAQVEDVLFGPKGCAPALSPGTLMLCCTTMPPEAARQIAKRGTEAGLLMLESPVSGGATEARAGALIFMGAGPAAAFSKAEPIFAAIAAQVFNLGEDYGAGSTMKMINQLLVGVHIATAAEAMALGIRAGLKSEKVFEVISASAGNSWVWQDRVPQILAGDDSPFSAVKIFIKDLGIVLDEGRILSFPMALAPTAYRLYLAAAAAGQADKGDTFVIRVWETLAGIELPSVPQRRPNNRQRSRRTRLRIPPSNKNDGIDMNRRKMLRVVAGSGLGAPASRTDFSFEWRLHQRRATRPATSLGQRILRCLSGNQKAPPYRIAFANSLVGNDARTEMVKISKAYAARPAMKALIKDFSASSSENDVSAQIAQL